MQPNNERTNWNYPVWVQIPVTERLGRGQVNFSCTLLVVAHMFSAVQNETFKANMLCNLSINFHRLNLE